jgi:acyl-CoA hydrolase
MLPLHRRRYIDGAFPGLRHVSWFLSPADRDAFHAGACDLVPNNFSEVPRLMRSLAPALVVVAVSPPDRHGYFSLGGHADYVAGFAGEVPFFVEVNPRVPRTFGENQLHVSQVVGWCESETPLVELPPVPASDADRRIAAFIAERVPDGSTLQVGVGAVPNAVLELLRNHRDLGIHTELFGEGFIDLVERGVITGTRKQTHRNRIIATTALGTRRMFAFLHENPAIEFWPVDDTNDPGVVAREDGIISINATLEVDFLGQCASESLGSDYWSSSGGQPDFARGAVMARRGQSFIVLHSTTSDTAVSRIVPRLHPGAAVTTFKNVVDKVVTEHGVAELRGRSIRERAGALIAIAHPDHRDELRAAGRRLGYL